MLAVRIAGGPRLIRSLLRRRRLVPEVLERIYRVEDQSCVREWAKYDEKCGDALQESSDTCSELPIIVTLCKLSCK